MDNPKRRFRGDASFAAEKLARDAVGPMLQSHGFDLINDTWLPPISSKTQVITARLAGGELCRMLVKTCWRWKDQSARKYSATQLTARLVEGSWDKTLARITQRAERRATHFLIVQADGDQIVLAALVPTSELAEIWRRQRDVSQQLIDTGRLGRLRKNHAQNGQSPTLYLRDERGPGREALGNVVWKWPGVVDVLALPARNDTVDQEDTFDDLPGLSDMGRDEGARKKKVVRSGFARNMAVRKAVRDRAGGVCERDGCDERRDFAEFLDVHHVMGIENSDRVWTCVALCPNCHREAHFSPDCDALNARLANYASQFRDHTSS